MFLFFHASVVLSCDFFSTIYFPYGFYLRNFQSLPSLGTVSSVPMRCSFFLWVCGISLLALPFPLFLYCSWFPFLFLSFLFITSLLFLGALLTLSHLRFPPRRGPPFGPSQFLFGLFALLLVHSSFAHLSTFLYVCIILLLFRSF